MKYIRDTVLGNSAKTLLCLLAILPFVSSTSGAISDG
ncbi:MAG: hypothetical protein ACI91J_001285, partial [Yoonia sp.]